MRFGYSVPEAQRRQTGERPKSPTAVASLADGDAIEVCKIRGGGSCGRREGPTCDGPGVLSLVLTIDGGREDAIGGTGN